MNKTDTELKANRRMLAEIIYDNGFTSEITPQTVSMLNEEGFAIGGNIGANFNKDVGLTVWSKGKRNTRQNYTLEQLTNKLKQLTKLEKELKQTFDEIWKS